MKAGDLAIVYALRALLDQGPDYLGRVTVVHNSDEEIGSPSSKRIVAERAGQSAAVLVLEAGRENGDVVLARKGIVDIEARVSGRAAHAGVNHDDGRSAVLSLAHLVIAMEGLNGQLPGLTVNVGRLEGGDRPNVVPDHAYARLELRAFDRDVLETAVARVREIAERETVPGTKADLSVTIEHWPMHRSEASEGLFHRARNLASQLGITLGSTSTGGASDGNTAAAAGRPVLDGLGPVGGGAHSEREYISLESIVPRTAILAGLIAELSDPAPRDMARPW
jgi:glutamate carboxypeptidase